MGDDKFELDLPSDGDGDVQLEQSEDEGFSLHGKQINCEICGNKKLAKKQLHCYTCINDRNVQRKTQRASARKPFVVLGKRRRLEETNSHLQTCTGAVS